MTVDVELLKRPLRAVRAWPPLNVPVTAGLRACLRALGRPPGLLSRFLPRVGGVDAALPDGRTLLMWSRADDDVTPQVYWKGWAGHEPEASTCFYEFARSARCTLDVGAHVGYFALLAAHANPSGTVYAFEPHPLAYERLVRNTALNDLHNLSCERVAVGSERGTAPFFHLREGLHSSPSLSREFVESIMDRSRLVSSEVDVVALDEFVAQRGVNHVDLVKIDTETTEDEVLAGMRHVLERDTPVIFCEVLHERTGRSIEEMVRPLGYRFFLLQPDGPVPSDRISPHPSWRNFCLVPPSRPDPA